VYSPLAGRYLDFGNRIASADRSISGLIGTAMDLSARRDGAVDHGVWRPYSSIDRKLKRPYADESTSALNSPDQVEPSRRSGCSVALKRSLSRHQHWSHVRRIYNSSKSSIQDRMAAGTLMTCG